MVNDTHVHEFVAGDATCIGGDLRIDRSVLAQTISLLVRGHLVEWEYAEGLLHRPVDLLHVRARKAAERICARLDSGGDGIKGREILAIIEEELRKTSGATS